MSKVEPICLFCLDETGEEFKHSFDCDCTFQYHQKCLDEWIKVKRMCPICRKNEQTNNHEVQHNNQIIYYQITIIDIFHSIFDRKVLCILFGLISLLLLISTWLIIKYIKI